MIVPLNFCVSTHFKVKIEDKYNIDLAPLSPLLAEKDYKLIMLNKKHLKGVFGELDDWWPSDTLNKRDNYNTLSWHEKQFKKRKSFAYAIFLNGEYIGCFYIYGLEVVHKIVSVKDPSLLYVFMWTAEKYFINGMDKIIFIYLKKWIELEWNFAKADFPGRISPLISWSKETASWIKCKNDIW